MKSDEKRKKKTVKSDSDGLLKSSIIRIQMSFSLSHTHTYTHTHTHIYIYIYREREREREQYTLNKFPDFFHMGTFIDSTHMKL